MGVSVGVMVGELVECCRVGVGVVIGYNGG